MTLARDIKDYCVNCRFWVKNQWHMTGECRRHAPTLVESDLGKQFDGSRWPQTRETDSCGDFERKEVVS